MGKDVAVVDVRPQVILEQHPDGLIIGAMGVEVADSVGIHRFLDRVEAALIRLQLDQLVDRGVVILVTRRIEHRHIFETSLV